MIYANPPSGDSNDDSDMRSLRYPFLELGRLKMHIPYHFAIMNSGAKLECLFPKPKDIDFGKYFPWADTLMKSRLIMVHRLYRTWMECTPDFAPESKPPSKQGSVIGGVVQRSPHHGNSRGSRSVDQEGATGHPEGEGGFKSNGTRNGGTQGVEEIFAMSQDEEDEEDWTLDDGARIIKWLGGLTIDSQENAE